MPYGDSHPAERRTEADISGCRKAVWERRREERAFLSGREKIDCWDLNGSELEGLQENLRVARYCEKTKRQRKKNGYDW